MGAAGTVRGVKVSAFDTAPAPAEVTARSVIEYCVPLVSEETVNGFAGFAPPVIVSHEPPSSEYWYDVIAEPPFEVGAVHAIDPDALSGVAVVNIGAEGSATGVTEAEP